MKKVLAALIICMLFISIAGCGGEQAAQNNTNVTKEVNC